MAKKKRSASKRSKRSSSKRSSRKRSSKRKVSPKMKSWTNALKKAGYLKKGSFKKIPRKGTKEYKKVKALMKK